MAAAAARLTSGLSKRGLENDDAQTPAAKKAGGNGKAAVTPLLQQAFSTPGISSSEPAQEKYDFSRYCAKCAPP